VFSFFGLVDLLSILPTFIGALNLTFLKSARVLRILRLLRMVRLAKLARFRAVSDPEHHASIYWLNIQIYFTALFATVLALGALIYIFEAPAEGFESIPAGMLWAADMVLGGSITGLLPQTLAGQLIGLLARFAGLALLGVLIHVIGTLLKRWLFGEKS
jgi:voltage-gated potassium channel